MSPFSAHNDYSDEVLLEMLRSEHDHAWALQEIFRRYNLRLFRMAVNVLRDEAIAKDLVQIFSLIFGIAGIRQTF